MNLLSGRREAFVKATWGKRCSFRKSSVSSKAAWSDGGSKEVQDGQRENQGLTEVALSDSDQPRGSPAGVRWTREGLCLSPCTLSTGEARLRTQPERDGGQRGANTGWVGIRETHLHFQAAHFSFVTREL